MQEPPLRTLRHPRDLHRDDAHHNQQTWFPTGSTYYLNTTQTTPTPCHNRLCTFNEHPGTKAHTSAVTTATDVARPGPHVLTYMTRHTVPTFAVFGRPANANATIATTATITTFLATTG